MPTSFYASQISKNIHQTPEGFLVCTDVPLGRTGIQEYAPGELGIRSDRHVVYVNRDQSEVFHQDAIASFNGKDVTDQHPPRFVDAGSWAAFSKGHVQNVRKGGKLPSGEHALIGDLVIKDPILISKVQAGQREISCGYNYELVPSGDGTYEQRSIRGNHVAVVTTGRAGKEVRINDAAVSSRKDRIVNLSLHDMGQFFAGFLGRKAIDAVENDPVANAENASEEEKKRAAKRNEDAEMKHGAECDCADCKDKRAGDKKAKDAKKMKDAETEEEKEKAKKKSEDDDIGEMSDSELIPVETLPPGDRPQNPITGADGFRAAKQALLSVKDSIQQTGNRQAIDKWNAEYTALHRESRDAYSRLANPKKPDEVRNAESRATAFAQDADPEMARINNISKKADDGVAKARAALKGGK